MGSRKKRFKGLTTSGIKNESNKSRKNVKKVKKENLKNIKCLKRLSFKRRSNRNRSFEDDDCVIIDETVIINDDDDNDGKNQKTSQIVNEKENVKESLFYEDTGSSITVTKSSIPIYTPLNLNTLTESLKDIKTSNELNTTNTTEKNDESILMIEDEGKSPLISKSSKELEERNKNDDSVIFVGEILSNKTPSIENKQMNNFISILEDNSLVTVSRKSQSKTFKEFKRFNKNKKRMAFFGGSKEKKGTKKRMIIVDGSNVAYAHALNKGFSVEGLKICIDYLKNLGHEVKAVVPQNRLKKDKSSNQKLLEKLYNDGEIVLTPCKNLPGKSTQSYDDRFILQLAIEFDAAIISNDNYRDLLNEDKNLKIIIENRVIGYTWCKDVFILPKDPYGRFGPTLSQILNI